MARNWSLGGAFSLLLASGNWRLAHLKCCIFQQSQESQVAFDFHHEGACLESAMGSAQRASNRVSRLTSKPKSQE